MKAKIIIVLSTIAATLVLSNAVRAEDMNCMLCHKLFGLSGFSDDGKLKVYYINETLNNRSPHSKVECGDCHAGIKEVPHKDVKPVNCTVECHIEEPSNKVKFSHAAMQTQLDRSVHAKKEPDGDLKKYAEDYPDCRDCHEQPLYRTLAGMAGSHETISAKGISRCKSCHEKSDFVDRYFIHIASRMQKQRNPIERIEVCASCHGDKEIIARHKMDDVVSSYKETFHYKIVNLGAETTPDCIDCHSQSVSNGHTILSKKDTNSPTHPSNVGQTCKQSDCHKNASEKLAGFQTHVTYQSDKYPLQYYLLMFFRIVMTVVLYFFFAIVFLELFRRLFPKFHLSKS